MCYTIYTVNQTRTQHGVGQEKKTMRIDIYKKNPTKQEILERVKELINKNVIRDEHIGEIIYVYHNYTDRWYEEFELCESREVWHYCDIQYTIRGGKKGIEFLEHEYFN
jgi:hypothetical protein